MKNFTGFILVVVILLNNVLADDFVPEGEEDITYSANVLTLDGDDTGGDIILQFGNTLAESLEWDSVNARFRLSDSIDLGSNELIAARVENLSTAPTCNGANTGRVYYDIVDKQQYVCDGSAWMSGRTSQSFTGRSYFYTDRRWISWSSNLYGPSYFQWLLSGGTATNPTIPWTAIGLFLPKGTRINGITMVGRVNSTQVTDIESLWQVRYANPTSTWETGINVNTEFTAAQVYRGFWWNNVDAGQPAFTGATNQVHRRHFPLDYVLTEDAYLDQVLKPVGTLTATQYFYGSTTIDYQLPKLP